MSLQYLLFILFIIKIIVSFPQKTEKGNEKAKHLRKTDELSNDIVLIHLNDVHCGINDKIGYDGFVLYRNELKKKYKHVITVDVGDHIQGGTLGAISEGEAIINIMNKVDFDVVTIGNHEFDYTVEQLFELNDKIKSKYICANFYYKKNKTSIFNASKVLDIEGTKIGFVGVVTPLAFTKSYLSTVQENGDFVYDFLINNGVQDLYDRVQKEIDILRNETKVNYVILLTHIGMDVEEYTSNDLLSNLTGVDAVFDGHTHLIYNVTSKDKSKKDILITQTGTKLESIGQLIISTNGLSSSIIEEVPEPTNKTGVLSFVRDKKTVWVDEEMNKFLNDTYDQYRAQLDLVVGHSDFDFIIKPEENSDSHLIYCRSKECTLGNLISDSIKTRAGADLAILNGGAIRNNLKKGNLTRGDIINAFPWFGNVILKELPGQTILDVLEFGVRNYPKPSGGFPQVSEGISYNFDPNINSTVVVDKDGFFVNITGERRVTKVKVNGIDLDLKKNYTVAMREFMGKGGDGYSMLNNYEVLREGLTTDTDCLTFYIQENLKGNIPKKYSEYQIRVVNLNETEPETEPKTTPEPKNETEPETETDFNKYQINNQNKKSGLSSGAIVAIVIPSVLILGVALILVLKMKIGASAVAPGFVDSSVSVKNNLK